MARQRQVPDSGESNEVHDHGHGNEADGSWGHADGRTVCRKYSSATRLAMGILACRFDSSSSRLPCSIPHGAWYFIMHADSLTGELRLGDNTRFREVRTIRSYREEHR
jgi:hypothetical protein